MSRHFATNKHKDQFMPRQTQTIETTHEHFEASILVLPPWHGPPKNNRVLNRDLEVTILPWLNRCSENSNLSAFSFNRNFNLNQFIKVEASSNNLY